jgi:hypothetical protein
MADSNINILWAILWVISALGALACICIFGGDRAIRWSRKKSRRRKRIEQLLSLLFFVILFLVVLKNHAAYGYGYYSLYPLIFLALGLVAFLVGYMIEKKRCKKNKRDAQAETEGGG